MFNFFKLYKPKEYGYRPIYYDPKKEAMKERMRSAEYENNADDTQTGKFHSSIKRGTFREMANQNKKTRSVEIRKSNFRLILILILLFILIYFIIM